MADETIDEIPPQTVVNDATKFVTADDGSAELERALGQQVKDYVRPDEATPTTAGLQSAADKSTLDALPAQVTSAQATAMAAQTAANTASSTATQAATDASEAETTANAASLAASSATTLANANQAMIASLQAELDAHEANNNDPHGTGSDAAQPYAQLGIIQRIAANPSIPKPALGNAMNLVAGGTTEANFFFDSPTAKVVGTAVRKSTITGLEDRGLEVLEAGTYELVFKAQIDSPNRDRANPTYQFARWRETSPGSGTYNFTLIDTVSYDTYARNSLTIGQEGHTETGGTVLVGKDEFLVGDIIGVRFGRQQQDLPAADVIRWIVNGTLLQATKAHLGQAPVNNDPQEVQTFHGALSEEDTVDLLGLIQNVPMGAGASGVQVIVSENPITAVGETTGAGVTQLTNNAGVFSSSAPHSNQWQAFLFPVTYVTTHTEALIRIIERLDGTGSGISFNVPLDDSRWITFLDTDTNFRWYAWPVTRSFPSLATAEIQLSEIDQTIRMAPSLVDLRQNITDVAFTQLDPELQSRFTSSVDQFSPNVRAQINGIEIDQETVAMPSVMFWWHPGTNVSQRFNPDDQTQSDYFGPQTNLPPYGGDGDFWDVVLLIPNAVQSITIGRSDLSPGSPTFVKRLGVLDTHPDFRIWQVRLPQTANVSPWGISGMALMAEAVALQSRIKLKDDNFTNAQRQALYHNEEELSDQLAFLQQHLSLLTRDNPNWTSLREVLDITKVGEFVRNVPGFGFTHPVASIPNEVAAGTGVTATATPLTAVDGVRGPADDRVSDATNGALEGPGLLEEALEVDGTADELRNANFEGIMTFDLTADSGALVERVLRGTSTRRTILGWNSTGLFANVQTAPGGTTQQTEEVAIRDSQNRYSHNYGAAQTADETIWIRNNTNLVTISAVLLANGNNEGTVKLAVTISNLNSNVISVVQTNADGSVINLGSGTSFPLTLGYNNGNVESATLFYQPSSGVYSGPGHSLHLQTPTLTHDQNFDIDHLVVSAEERVTRDVPTAPTFANTQLTNAYVSGNRLERVGFTLYAGTNGNLWVNVGHTGVLADGVFSSVAEVALDLGYSAALLDHRFTYLGGAGVVGQRYSIGIPNSGAHTNQLRSSEQIRQKLISFTGDRYFNYGDVVAPGRGSRGLFLDTPIVGSEGVVIRSLNPARQFGLAEVIEDAAGNIVPVAFNFNGPSV